MSLRKTITALSAATAASLALAACGSSMPTAAGAKQLTVSLANRANLGAILVDGTGQTLYHYTPDHANDPTCVGGCAKVWPPLTVTSGEVVQGLDHLQGFGKVKLANGTYQVTYRGVPLYRYSGDHGGSANGQGIGGIWFVVHSSTQLTGGSSSNSGTPTTAASSGSAYNYG
ncbi:MAG: COG4315 family predicted lipoprotein [Acidimicrobiales bacterium]